MKIAFADRTRFMADPLTTEIPLEWMMSEAYADERRAQIDMARAQQFAHGNPHEHDSRNTTTCAAMDAEGNVVATTNTLRMGFGSKVTVPGTGLLHGTDGPAPGSHQFAPGKRGPLIDVAIVLHGGKPVFAVGSVGGLRIFGSVFQAIVSFIDHGMTVQEAIEAPRAWDRGPVLELEDSFSDITGLTGELERRGHEVDVQFRIGGGMNAISADPETGLMTGAADWRADGTGWLPAATPVDRIRARRCGTN